MGTLEVLRLRRRVDHGLMADRAADRFGGPERTRGKHRDRNDVQHDERVQLGSVPQNPTIVTEAPSFVTKGKMLMLKCLRICCRA